MERAEVDVWLLPRPTALPPTTWLDDAERGRAAGLPPVQARGFVAGRRLLRAVLGRRFGVPPGEVQLVARCVRCGGPHGQVRVDAPSPCHVSISRSGPSIAVATAEMPVGVDVESVDAVAAAPLVDVVLSAAERERYDRLPAPARAEHLARTWARKEAVLKARGTGLDVDPASLDLDEPADDGAAVADLPPRPGEAGAVAVLAAGAAAGGGAVRAGAGAREVCAVVVRMHDGEALLART